VYCEGQIVVTGIAVSCGVVCVYRYIWTVWGCVCVQIYLDRMGQSLCTGIAVLIGTACGYRYRCILLGRVWVQL